jgi:hypothetical protein
MGRILTINEFIQKAKKIHDDKCDYSKVNYIDNKTKVIIICPKHGEFLQAPYKHLKGQGCCECAQNKKSTLKHFIDKVNKIHNNKYNYDKFIYINNGTKGIIICPEHGEFTQSPIVHLKNHGCPECTRNKKLTLEIFIQKARKIHGEKYSYSKVIYINAHTKIIIICLKHGEFTQIPDSHLRGSGCPYCFATTKLTLKQFISKANKIHNNKYNYDKFIYISAHIKGIINCYRHGNFKQSSANHLSGKGCPSCSHNCSNASQKWLDEMGVLKEYREKSIIINGRKFIVDAFDPKTNTIYEYNGYFFHGHPDFYNPNEINKVAKQKFGDLYKKTLEKEDIIKKAGYNLIVKWGE